MLVVSNTSPLIALACIGRLNLLRERYEHVTIPCEVCNCMSDVIISGEHLSKKYRLGETVPKRTTRTMSRLIRLRFADGSRT